MNMKCCCYFYHRECTEKCNKCLATPIDKTRCANTNTQNANGELINITHRKAFKITKK